MNDSVMVYMDLRQIVDVTEKDGVLTVKLWIYFYFMLEEPLWDVSQFWGVKSMQFPMDSFWRPDIGELSSNDQMIYAICRYSSIIKKFVYKQCKNYYVYEAHSKANSF